MARVLAEENSEPIICREPRCLLPFGIMTVGGLQVMSYHHGEKHYNLVSYPDLLRIISAYQASLPPALRPRVTIP